MNEQRKEIYEQRKQVLDGRNLKDTIFGMIRSGISNQVTLHSGEHGKLDEDGVREILGGFRRIVVCELNEGQLASYLRQQFQEFRFGQYNKCEGLPFTVVELKEEFNRILNEK